MEVGQAVEELDGTTLALELGDAFLESLWDDAVSIDGYVLDVGLVGREDAERANVGRSLSQDDVTGVDKQLRDDVNGLLGPGGDNDVLGVGVDSLQSHNLRDLLAQGR